MGARRRHVAVSYLDRVWTMTPEGRQPKAVTPGSETLEREPAWSPDGIQARVCGRPRRRVRHLHRLRQGRHADCGDAMPGDERWPSWTPDGRLVFAHRDRGANGRVADPALQWDLFVVAPVARVAPPGRRRLRLTDTPRTKCIPASRPMGGASCSSPIATRWTMWISSRWRCRPPAVTSRCRSAPRRGTGQAADRHAGNGHASRPRTGRRP